MSKIPVWFDTDIGVDDAVAFLVMNKLPQLEVKGISAVAGNVELIHTYANARNICAFVGADYPVYKGADRPLLQEARTAASTGIQVMADNAVVESRIENLVIAKGYADCVAFINDNGVNVIVSKTENGLTDTDVARIRDIVISEANVTADAIKIIETE